MPTTQALLLLLAVLGAVVAVVLNIPKPRNTPLPTHCHAPFGDAPVFERTFTSLHPSEAFHVVPATSAASTLNERTYDVVVFGATGFTGRLVAEYLGRVGASETLAWAIAGRSEKKLRALVASSPSIMSNTPGLILADTTNPASLAALAAQAKVVLSTVGPYTLRGEPLVAACAQAGTHYVDLAGEFFWQRRMIDTYGPVAERTGAKLVFAGGYDSLPFDLGALRALMAYRERYGEDARPVEITSVVTQSRGLASGGTLDSMGAILGQLRAGEETWEDFNDPYLLVPGASCRPDAEVSGWGFHPHMYGGFVGVQHFMAGINARVVRRSLALLGVHDATYAEAMSVGALVDALAYVGKAMWAGDVALGDLRPAAGSGPPAAVMRTGRGSVSVFATGSTRGEAGQSVATAVEVRVELEGDVGYNATSRMISQAALCLADDTCHTWSGGGALTPATAFGLGYIARMEGLPPSERAISFEVVE